MTSAAPGDAGPSGAFTLPPATTHRWRRRIPDPLVAPMARLRAEIERHRPGRLAAARRAMDFLVGAEVSPDELDALALRHLRWLAWRSEYKYHPALVNRMPVHGIEILRELEGRPGGALISFTHHGPFDGSMASIASAGVPIEIVVTATMFDPAGLEALRVIAEVGCSTGNTLINVADGSGAIRAALDRGAMVGIAHDVIGSTTVEFLGRRRKGSAGLAHIAMADNVPIVTVRTRRDDAGQLSVHLDGPWWPSDHPDALSLLQALLDHHAEVVRTWPEGYEYPLDRWGPVED